MAINTPIQGSAADIIKLAMINIFRRFGEYGLKSKMILQIHDDLLFEVVETEIDTVKKLVKEEMESFDLQVPLTVNVKMGVNWYDLKNIDP
jgi:DNA polymerase-1